MDYVRHLSTSIYSHYRILILVIYGRIVSMIGNIK